MPQARANGIDIEYESFGSARDEAILLIMGLGSQLTVWPLALCHALVAKGYRVIRYDNRDCGLSSRIEGFGFSDFRSALAVMGQGRLPVGPYSLEDMAADAVGLLDALGIARAHIVGASMGGMIAQLVAALYPDRVISLTSIMSSSGNPRLPAGKPEAMSVLMRPAPAAGNMDAIVAHGFKVFGVLSSPGFPTDEETLKQHVRSNAERAYYPQGILRQLAAVMTNGDRRPKLKRIKAPTLVLHGADDPLLPVEAGKDTADNIAGAEFRVIPGMGHDVPLALVPQFVDAILTAAERGSPKAASKSRKERVVAEPVVPSEIIDEVLPEPVAYVSEGPTPRPKFISRLREWFGQAPG